jgi:MFS family permease
MDHAGAVIGPVFAAGFLYFAPGEYRTLFGLTIIPGVLAVAMLLLVGEAPGGAASAEPERGISVAAEDEAGRTPRPPLPRSLRRYLLILTVFSLGNSSDAFLLLRLSDAGLAAAWLPLAWAGLHVIKSSLSTLGGTLSDRFGRRELIIGGWTLYAMTYAGFALSAGLLPTLAWFLFYGVHFAMVEGSEKALVADLVPSASHGTAFGWYNAVLGFGALGASVLFGFLWQTFGPAAAFFTGAGLAVTASALLAADRSLAWPS